RPAGPGSRSSGFYERVFEWWVPTPEDFGLSEQHYRIKDHPQPESTPGRGPAGHPLGSDTVLLGNHPCVKCTGFSHRTWRCRECDACWIWPACADPPERPGWARDEPSKEMKTLSGERFAP